MKPSGPESTLTSANCNIPEASFATAANIPFMDQPNQKSINLEES